MFVYTRAREERDLRIISAVKTSVGRAVALARAAARRGWDALDRAEPGSPAGPWGCADWE